MIGYSTVSMESNSSTARRPSSGFIIIINSRFVDDFQNRMLRRYFPEAVLNES